MAGRQKNKAYDELDYELVKVNNKHAAFCKQCKKNLFNTAEARLRAHRNVCKVNKSKEAVDLNATNISEMSISAEKTSVVYCLDLDDENAEVTDIESCRVITTRAEKDFFGSSSSSLASTKANSSTSINSNNDQSFSKDRKRSKSKQSSLSIHSFVDKLLPKEEEDITECLANFFYGCNIPLSVVDSIYFKKFIKKIRPAYADKVPGRKALSSRLLDTAYENCLASAKSSMSSDSVLLIDGWKNSSSNSKTVVSMLHNSNGEQAFVEAWDLSGESETAEKLAEIVAESVDLAEKMYSSNVYAVVSDNAPVMTKMGKITKHFVWKSNCSSHTANLLAKDILNKNLNQKVTSILKEFKHADLEKKIVEKGGSRMKLPCETRWCSYRDAYNCLIKNVQFMRLVAADSTIKTNIVSDLYDSEFMDKVKMQKTLMGPVCTIINKCQSGNCSSAEAVDMWLSLELPEEFSRHLKNRRDMALNKYALAAFYLHPFLDNSKLSSKEDNIIFNFLFEMLDGNGLEEWDEYKSKTGFFQKLYEKEIKNPLVFWSMAEKKYPDLAILAKKLLQIPASSAQIDGLFSSWAHVHSLKRNRLTFERSKKLLHIYYSLRIRDPFTDDEEDDDDIGQLLYS